MSKMPFNVQKIETRLWCILLGSMPDADSWEEVMCLFHRFFVLVVRLNKNTG